MHRYHIIQQNIIITCKYPLLDFWTSRMQIYRDVKYNGGYDGPNTTVYSTLVLFEQSTCIGWIHVCYIWLLTKK